MEINFQNKLEAIFSLQKEMLEDERLKALCQKYGLPWDCEAGYVPRWYNGPAPEKVQVLFMMAEPAPISSTERLSLGKPIANEDWFEGYNLKLNEHYWRENVQVLCKEIWPENTKENMHAHLAGSCTFWMSLPPNSATENIPKEVLLYFQQQYLKRLLLLFPNAIILAAGGKARNRLKKLNVDFEHCWAFTKPASNHPKAKISWINTGRSIKEKIRSR